VAVDDSPRNHRSDRVPCQLVDRSKSKKLHSKPQGIRNARCRAGGKVKKAKQHSGDDQAFRKQSRFTFQEGVSVGDEPYDVEDLQRAVSKQPQRGIPQVPREVQPGP